MSAENDKILVRYSNKISRVLLLKAFAAYSNSPQLPHLNQYAHVTNVKNMFQT